MVLVYLVSLGQNVAASHVTIFEGASCGKVENESVGRWV